MLDTSAMVKSSMVYYPTHPHSFWCKQHIVSEHKVIFQRYKLNVLMTYIQFQSYI